MNSTGSQLVIYESKLRSIRSKLMYDAALPDSSSDRQTTPEDRKIGKAFTLQSFQRWVEKHKYRVDWENPFIIIREIPNQPHSRTQAWISSQLIIQGGDDLIVGTEMSTQMRVSGMIWTPDVLAAVRGNSNIPNAILPGSTGYPAVVVEIGTSQDAADLHSRAAVYLGPEYPTVEYYISLKRYGARADGAQTMTAAVYDRALIQPGMAPQPFDIISFGTGGPVRNTTWSSSPLLRGVGVVNHPACAAPGMQFYTIVLHSQKVFASRVGGIPAGAPPNYSLDLFRVQQGFISLDVPM